MDLFLIIGIVWLLLAILIGMAAESADRSGFGWFFITLIFGVFGVLAYLATSPSKKEKELEQRVSELERGGNYCQTCGSELEDGRCPECDGEIETQTQEQQENEHVSTSEGTGAPFTKLLAYSHPSLVRRRTA
jgi:Na+/melibiose symporter-like transporter